MKEIKQMWSGDERRESTNNFRKVQTTRYKINKIRIQGGNVQHREYGQYFIITLNGRQSIKIANHYAIHLTLI